MNLDHTEDEAADDNFNPDDYEIEDDDDDEYNVILDEYNASNDEEEPEIAALNENEVQQEHDQGQTPSPPQTPPKTPPQTQPQTQKPSTSDG